MERICDIPDELEFELTNLMWELAPSIFNPETAEAYYESRLYADSCDEDGTSDSLYNVSCDIKKYVLPYFHQFDDLQHYYTQNSHYWNLADPVRYGLALKLHKYEDALKCVEYRLSDNNRIMNDYLQMKKD
ncbi:MAG: hypothetical protein NC320_10035 [Clostridium sp.]|nr:hypothetical protein [Clostridium sp.]MCM1548040.1 hypothetical protein [Ruminococcus sp.]